VAGSYVLQRSSRDAFMHDFRLRDQHGLQAQSVDYPSHDRLRVHGHGLFVCERATGRIREIQLSLLLSKLHGTHKISTLPSFLLLDLSPLCSSALFCAPSNLDGTRRHKVVQRRPQQRTLISMSESLLLTRPLKQPASGVRSRDCIPGSLCLHLLCCVDVASCCEVCEVGVGVVGADEGGPVVMMSNFCR